MTPDSVMTLGRSALEMTLLIGAPVLIVTLGIGLVVAVFQAATQINDASLSFIPKLVAVLVTFMLAGPWMLTLMIDYMQRLLTSIPTLIG